MGERGEGEKERERVEGRDGERGERTEEMCVLASTFFLRLGP